MSVEISQDMIGLEQASATLDQLMAADAASTSGTKAPADQSATVSQAANDGQRAAQTGKEATTQSSDSISDPANKAGTDTPAEAEKSKTEPATAAPNKDQQQQQTTKPESKFAKEQGRQKSAWEKINAGKAELEAERARLAEERKAVQAQRESASREKFKPEDYDKAAAKFEEQGKFDLAEAARERAKKLRENPEPARAANPDQAEQARQFEAQKKEWWSKASIDFPDVAKEGTAQNAALREFIKAEPAVLQNPRALYYGARMVAAETAAARVPGQEKELGELRAKVKELEALTAPNPPAVPGRSPAGEIPFNQRNSSEQLADLERQALDMGTLR